MKEMPSTAPYLLRAIYKWCCDSGQTPFIAVAVNAMTRVPMEHVRDGEIVLNIGPDATRNLKIDNDLIRFSARFNGVSHEVSVPVSAVKGIYAKESGQGLAFGTTEGSETEADQSAAPQEQDTNGTKPGESPRGRAKLEIVK